MVKHNATKLSNIYIEREGPNFYVLCFGFSMFNKKIIYFCMFFYLLTHSLIFVNTNIQTDQMCSESKDPNIKLQIKKTNAE